MTSELGGIGPVIVVPGPWTKADIAYQAQNIATQKLHNSGCNCVAAQVMITSASWKHRDALIDKLKRASALYRPATPITPARLSDRNGRWIMGEMR